MTLTAQNTTKIWQKLLTSVFTGAVVSGAWNKKKYLRKCITNRMKNSSTNYITKTKAQKDKW